MVSAVTTINTPAASTVVGGSTTDFNVTTTDVIGADGINDIVNLTFYAQSTLTANSSWVVVGTNNSVNMTLYENHTVTSVNTSTIEDANNYIFNVTIIVDANGTLLAEDTNTGMTVDNTIPTAATGLTSGVQTSSTPTISSTVVGTEVTGCTINFTQTNPGSAGYDLTHTGNTCSTSGITFPDQSFTYTIWAHDGTNATQSAESTVTVSTTSGGGGNIPSPTTPGTGDDNTNTLLIIIGVIGVSALLITKFKK